MSRYATITDADKHTLLRALAGGTALDVAAAAVHIAPGRALDIAKHHGYPDRAKLAWAADVVAKNAEADDVPPAATSAPTSAPARGERPDAIAQLLADAAASRRKRTRELGQRASKALDLVRAELRTERERDAQAEARKAAEAKVRAEVARLEKRLAELKRGLPKSTAVPPGATALGVDPKAVRRWAAANGVECTATGRVPRVVLDAYLAAQQATAEVRDA